MNDTILPQKFVAQVRVLLVRLAQNDDELKPFAKVSIERSRQYLEGFLGLDRDFFKTENPANVDDMLNSLGFIDTQE